MNSVRCDHSQGYTSSIRLRIRGQARCLQLSVRLTLNGSQSTVCNSINVIYWTWRTTCIFINTNTHLWQNSTKDQCLRLWPKCMFRNPGYTDTRIYCVKWGIDWNLLMLLSRMPRTLFKAIISYLYTSQIWSEPHNVPPINIVLYAWYVYYLIFNLFVLYYSVYFCRNHQHPTTWWALVVMGYKTQAASYINQFGLGWKPPIWPRDDDGSREGRGWHIAAVESEMLAHIFFQEREENVSSWNFCNTILADNLKKMHHVP